MKTTILATFALSALLFISCNSGSSNKNNAASNNETEQMQTGNQHDEMGHMESEAQHDEMGHMESHDEMGHMESGAQHDEMDHMTSAKAHEEHAMLNVKGNCEMCKERIEKAAKGVEGVSFANCEIDKQVLHLNYDPDKTSPDAVAQAVAAVGHDTDKYKADQATYDGLPSGCKYRD